MPNGYSIPTVEAIRHANPFMTGVQLGKICVEREIPVGDVAEYFGVSRVTVYQWFKGKKPVSAKHEAAVQQLIDKLK